jgi:hypothetical protein
VRRTPQDRRSGRGAVANLSFTARVAASLLTWALALPAQEPVRARPVEIDSGRFTLVAFPRDAALARSLLGDALGRDTFPGLPRPRAHARILVTPDALHFHDAIGPTAPAWGAAIATPENGRIVMQGSRASSAAGHPS